MTYIKSDLRYYGINIDKKITFQWLFDRKKDSIPKHKSVAVPLIL